MKLHKGYYFLDATKQPNEIYPISDLRMESSYDKWCVCNISGTIADRMRQTVDSISVSDEWSYPYPYKTPTRYSETTTFEPTWMRSLTITQPSLGTIEMIGTVKRIPIFLQSDTKPYGIKKVIFHDPATIVLWEDGTKTVVKCQKGDTYSKEVGLAMCMLKKYMGNKGNFNEVFKKYCGDDENEG